MDNDLHYKAVKPTPELSDFIESFWMLHNDSDQTKDVIILPDGRIDLFISKSTSEPFHISLQGIGAHAGKGLIYPRMKTFAISFKLLASEYILHDAVSNLVDKAKILPALFWDFVEEDLIDFGNFCKKVSGKLSELIPATIDERKRELFQLLHDSNGALAVAELAGKVFWSSRQINRYFTKQFGISLKAYCNILRFRASFQHIKDGKLYPSENFSDQSHFIKEIKKLAGVIPKELRQNQNDRFIQLSALPEK